MKHNQPWNENAFGGKTVMISGAGTGLGQQVALRLGQLGANVILVGRRESPLMEVAGQLEQVGGRFLVRPADISDPMQVEATVKDGISRFGRIDGAWNNAGIEGSFADLQDQDGADIRAVIDTNLTGIIYSVKHQLKAMARLGVSGSIVNTSSWLSHGAMPGSTIYSASKAGLDGFIRAVALEAAAAGVRINNVNPGIIDTPMFRRFCKIGQEVPYIKHTPMGRLGTPDDVAGAVLWLLSDASRFVTGQNIRVDGGYAIAGQRK